jgi:hypothetical protein
MGSVLVDAIRARWSDESDVHFCTDCIFEAFRHADKQLAAFRQPAGSYCMYNETTDAYDGGSYDEAAHEFMGAPLANASADVHALLRYIEALERRVAELLGSRR